jgi:predicted RNA-binding Zn-ribbon protein involved in translation (DUF1610 family)
VKHTAECNKLFEEAMAAHEAWRQRWPKFCKTCFGKGVHEYSYDPSPAGVSLAPGRMTDIELCPDCTEKDICPRCGHHIDGLARTWAELDVELSCPTCGWWWGCTDSRRPMLDRDIMPMLDVECTCYGNW